MKKDYEVTKKPMTCGKKCSKHNNAVCIGEIGHIGKHICSTGQERFD